MANAKITQLTEETAPANVDLVAIVDDVAGTPTTKKATLTNLLALARSKTSAHASPPASPAAGDLWLPSDSFYAYRYSGSAWVPWGPIFPMATPPLVSALTWVNQGGATASETNGGIHLSAPASASHSVRALVKTAPATPYTITAAFLTSNVAVNYLACGLLFRQSSDGKLVTLQRETNSGFTSGWGVNSLTFDSPTAVVSEVAVIGALGFGVQWLRIADNGTNRICSFSADGQNWQVLHTVSRTSHLTADQVGIFCDSLNGSWPSNMTLLSWKEA